jgi:cobalt-zinc-cadmium efflux system outer membrane protein
MKVWNLSGRSKLSRLCLLLIIFGFADSFENANAASDLRAITLEDAIILVLEKNPVLIAADYEAGAAAARIRQARLAKSYSVNIGVENFAGSGAFTGFSGAETTLSIARVLERGEKPRWRGELAEVQASLLRTSQDARRLDLVAETARRFIHLVSDQENLQITKEALLLSQRTQNAVGQRVAAGKTGVAERHMVDITVARAKLELEHAEHELESSRLKLSTLWGETQPGFATVQADLYLINPVEEFNNLASLIDRNPDLVLLATNQRLDEARMALAQSGQQPDIELSGGVRYLGITDDVALVMTASIPLGSGKRAENLMEESRQSGLAKPFLYEQKRLTLYATLFEIYQELLHAQTAVESYRQQIIPSAEQALAEYDTGFSAGRYSLLELSAAQRVLLNARFESAKAAADFHRNQVEIERLTGTALNRRVNQ